MQSLSTDDREIISATLQRIKESILLLKEWNRDVNNIDDWLCSSSGMQNLAANCMLIEAIGEAVKNLEKRGGIEFLNQCPNIPWNDIKGMRNHIAHGYFDIDVEYVLSVIKNDIEPLSEAIDKLLLTI